MQKCCSRDESFFDVCFDGFLKFLGSFLGPKIASKIKQKNGRQKEDFFGLPGGFGGYREACLRPKRPLGMPLGYGNGKQEEHLTRPGPEVGRIVCASRIPPRPYEALRV